jgi:hypothetical protein
MPLTRLKDEYLEQDGVRFLMEDQDGSTVACRVSHQALWRWRPSRCGQQPNADLEAPPNVRYWG